VVNLERWRGREVRHNHIRVRVSEFEPGGITVEVVCEALRVRHRRRISEAAIMQQGLDPQALFDAFVAGFDRCTELVFAMGLSEQLTARMLGAAWDIASDEIYGRALAEARRGRRGRGGEAPLRGMEARFIAFDEAADCDVYAARYLERQEQEIRYRHQLEMLALMPNPQVIVGRGVMPRLPHEADPQADERARELLVRCLSPEQRRMFKDDGTFVVETPAGMRYRITSNDTYNVIDVASGARYCAYPGGVLPHADRMLGQKLVLETDPDSFFRVANRHIFPPERAPDGPALREWEAAPLNVRRRNWDVRGIVPMVIMFGSCAWLMSGAFTGSASTVGDGAAVIAAVLAAIAHRV
jgi:hypothetical protein